MHDDFSRALEGVLAGHPLLLNPTHHVISGLLLARVHVTKVVVQRQQVDLSVEFFEKVDALVVVVGLDVEIRMGGCGCRRGTG